MLLDRHDVEWSGDYVRQIFPEVGAVKDFPYDLVWGVSSVVLATSVGHSGVQGVPGEGPWVWRDAATGKAIQSNGNGEAFGWGGDDRVSVSGD